MDVCSEMCREMVVRRSVVMELGGRRWEWCFWRVCKSHVSMSPSSNKMRAAGGTPWKEL